MRLKLLEKEFTRKGVQYTQLLKNENFVIYQCNDKEMAYPYYELFNYRIVKSNPFDRDMWDFTELYPSDTMFGTYAWCCSCKESLAKCLKVHFDTDLKSLDIFH